MAFWNRKKKRTTAKPKINASISKVEKPKKISEKHDFVVHKEEHQVSLSPKPKMKNLPTFKPDRYEKEFMNIFRQLVSEKNRPWDIWKDFIVMSACSISNSVDKSQFDEREKRYLDIIRHYSKSKQELFPRLFANLVMSLEMNPEQDFLGKMYMSLNLGYDELKQIFTPYDMCRLMAKITITDVTEKVRKDGYITINDPCCGAGANLIAAIHEARKQLEKENYNYQNHLLVSGQDIEEVPALMCYIQLSLLGIAGYFKVGNSLIKPMTMADDLKNYWFTPIYFSDVWTMRRLFHSI